MIVCKIRRAFGIIGLSINPEYNLNCTGITEFLIQNKPTPERATLILHSTDISSSIM